MRYLLLFSLVIIAGIAFTARLLYLQVFKTSLKDLSESNAISIVYDYPYRAYIYDRNKELLVFNQPGYDVMAIPNSIKHLDTLDSSSALDNSKEYLDAFLAKAMIYSPRLPS